MKVVLITGMLASGKSIALRVFQDLGYYVIDNMPPSLIPTFLSLAAASNPKIEKAAFVVDVRAEGFFADLNDAVDYLEENTVFDILFIDAEDGVLLSRYKLNRRRHIAFDEDRISEAINKERERLEPIKEKADYYIDTSNLTEKKFKKRIHEIFDDGVDEESRFLINVVSFGFKYGILEDADMVFDARFAPNPYYVEELKAACGLDEKVRDYVFKFDETREFLDKITELITFLLPYFEKEGKTQLVVGVGCSGGRHRSVAIAEQLTKNLLGKTKCIVLCEHRDIQKDNKQ